MAVVFVWGLWLVHCTGRRDARAITFLALLFPARLPVLQARLEQHSSRKRCVPSPVLASLFPVLSIVVSTAQRKKSNELVRWSLITCASL